MGDIGSHWPVECVTWTTTAPLGGCMLWEVQADTSDWSAFVDQMVVPPLNSGKVAYLDLELLTDVSITTIAPSGGCMLWEVQADTRDRSTFVDQMVVSPLNSGKGAYLDLT